MPRSSDIVPPPASASASRNSASRVPVLIVGAGPVGLSLALGLAAHQVPSRVVETHGRDDPALRVGSRAICFQRDVLDILARLGVANRLLAEGVTWTTARTYYREHEVRTVSFDPDPAAATGAQPSTRMLPPWINISQARVHEELLHAAERSPLVEVWDRHRFTELVQDDTGVTAQVIDPDGHQISLAAEYLVGADGARSAVRRSLGIDFPGDSFDDRFLICDIRADLPFPQERRFYFDPEWNPGRQVLVHQCPERTWRIDWQVPADYDLEAERDSGGLDQRIRKIVGDRPYEVVWTSVYRFHQRCAERFRQGRVFLAGDAAHLFAPFGARGLNSGFQDADNLAWKLAAVHTGWRLDTVSQSEAAEAVLASYETERRSAAQENLRVTSATMRFLVPQNAEQRRYRQETLHRSVTDPQARARIDSGTLAEPHPYTDSPLTRPADIAAEPEPVAPGAILPDAPCQLHRESHRLRYLLRGTFTLLLPDRRHADRHTDALSAAGPYTPPVAVRCVSELDPDGLLAQRLHLGPGCAYVVRPDAHVCAVVAEDDTAAVRAALARACGRVHEELVRDSQP
ncbi:FAD-dependent monooxygenase [Lipingzhangella sp. LS1_29]|uniref:FAD-dependent monooxygenase n=1 Tax=Lipingzhangella rawalii TaxID=2055835 RepID=A0ABU2H6N8_9ACTN|nr:FAD-dependent monooxygenase [Lipingzhangella rawalii]MDS1270971.1 FAD-dependent monooxygenase [Lipingzhangella rawalii]